MTNRMLIKCVYCSRGLLGDPNQYTEEDLKNWRTRHEVTECG
ncbi:hypothetical protein EDF62_3281 [Leucobacter luti]|uniref:Uncharacterized protein n=1 Tax=Leucobacter luti TaxID=340320 RepID=A0A4R6RRY8_9MICO|nr:hypothetical protein EDF62_3281 [Leucobacter luti]